MYGSANCSYDIFVDESLWSFQAARGSQLFHIAGLREETHQLTLVANASNGSSFSFDWTDITRPLSGYGCICSWSDSYLMKVSRGTIPSSQVYAATNTNFFEYSGDWLQVTDPNGQIPNTSHPAPFYEVKDPPASLWFTFQGTGIAVNGSRNWGGYTYNVVSPLNSVFIIMMRALSKDSLDARQCHFVLQREHDVVDWRRSSLLSGRPQFFRHT